MLCVFEAGKGRERDVLRRSVQRLYSEFRRQFFDRIDDFDLYLLVVFVVHHPGDHQILCLFHELLCEGGSPGNGLVRMYQNEPDADERAQIQTVRTAAQFHRMVYRRNAVLRHRCFVGGCLLSGNRSSIL